jgi:dihydroxy-acid dehydratase
MAAEDAEKADSTEESARFWSRRLKNRFSLSQILTRKAFENAISVIMAVGGST